MRYDFDSGKLVPGDKPRRSWVADHPVLAVSVAVVIGCVWARYGAALCGSYFAHHGWWSR